MTKAERVKADLMGLSEYSNKFTATATNSRASFFPKTICHLVLLSFLTNLTQ